MEITFMEVRGRWWWHCTTHHPCGPHHPNDAHHNQFSDRQRKRKFASTQFFLVYTKKQDL